MAFEPPPPSGQPDANSPDVDIEAGLAEPPSLENSLADLPPPPIHTS